MYIASLIAGFGGGMVRGLVGYIKYQYSYKNVGFKMAYFLGMSFLSGIIGILSAAAIKELGMGFFGSVMTPAMAFIVGYAGGDFIENIFKIVMKSDKLFSFPNEKK